MARRRREGRQVRRHQTQVEGQRARELAGAIDDPGPAREAPALFGVAAQVRERRGVEPPLHLLEALARADRREHVGAREGVAAWRSARCSSPRPRRRAVTASSARTSLRATSSGAPWSQISTATFSRPKRSTRARARGARRAVPRSSSAVVRGPLRQPVSTSQSWRRLAHLVEREARRALLAALEVRLAEHARERGRSPRASARARRGARPRGRGPRRGRRRRRA